MYSQLLRRGQAFEILSLLLLHDLCASVRDSCVWGPHPIFGPPTLVPTVVSAVKLLTMPPQKKSKKNTPTETDQEEHYNFEDNGISLTIEPSHTTDQKTKSKT
jgi:hypothetical protein